MRVGIVGGPEAGKSNLARFIDENFENKLIVIDNYVNELSKKLDVAFGPFATYLGNIQIAIERLNAELYVGGDDFITCGTLVETMAYAALYGLKHLDSRTERARVTTTMDFFGMMMQETYLYDKLFYLSSQDKELDYQIEYAFRLFHLVPFRVEKDKYDGVIDSLKELEEYLQNVKAAETEQSRVRPSE